MRCKIAVLASGRGSNLLALVEFLTSCGSSASSEIAVVLANTPQAAALQVAAANGIRAEAFNAGDDGAELGALLSKYQTDLVVLAGYLKKIPARVVRAFPRRILNIHPALLPAHGGSGMYGARVHEAVIANGDTETGVTVHLVDDEYDRGAIVAQWRIPVLAGESAESLAKRVLEIEHTVYPRVVDMVASLQLLENR
jgi:phosphoribosylglycinamide formyltransferase, formyltetrahydrofolate-dependent